MARLPEAILARQFHHLRRAEEADERRTDCAPFRFRPSPDEGVKAGRDVLGGLGIHEVASGQGEGIEEDLADIMGL